jgi:hypothetical protein
MNACRRQTAARRGALDRVMPDNIPILDRGCHYILRESVDVLKAYTPVNSNYKLVKKTDGDPEFDTKKEAAPLCRKL